MPRKSPYQIVLNTEERKTLDAISKKYTSPYNTVMRAKVILFASEDYDNKKIGEKLDLPRQIVSKWRKRFFYEGIHGLDDQPRRGRPRDFSPSSSNGN
jgi:transposase